MKYSKPLILVSIIVAWAVVLTNCTSQPDDETKLVSSEKMAFGAALVAPDSIKVIGKDTVYYYHRVKTGTGTLPAQTYTYNYNEVYTVIGIGNVTPPDTTIPPPVGGQTYPLSFTALPVGDPDINRPWAGFEQWHDRNDVNLGYTPSDVYYRTTWNRFEGTTENSWNFSWLKARCDDAIAKKQKLSFGIMSVYGGVDANTGGIFIDGAWSAVPAYLISRMNTESPKAWKSGAGWTPNWNSPYYLDRCLALNKAIYNWLSTTRSAGGILYKDVINAIDIRLYGNWGEWHSAGIVDNVNQYPAGTFPTAASLKKIVDAHTQGFPDIQLSAMIAGFDAHWLNNTYNPPEIAWYLLTQRNAKGMIGWRRDQWGATDNYLTDYLKNNNRSFNGLTFKDSIVPRFKTAPVTGEPPAWIPNDYADLQNQVNDYNPTSIGNGNYGTNTPNSTIQSRVKAASKSMGARLAPASGSIVTGSGNIAFNLIWTNKGKAPTYDDWIVTYELVNSAGTVVKTYNSKAVLRLALGSFPVSETFSAAGLTGTFTVRMKVVDAKGYRSPYPLQITGRNSDGSYTLKTITL